MTHLLLAHYFFKPQRFGAGTILGNWNCQLSKGHCFPFPFFIAPLSKAHDQYKRIQGRQRTLEDDKLKSLYASISKGARVINIGVAFKETGLNERGEPRLAIARTDWKEVHFHPRRRLLSGWGTEEEGGGGFSDNQWWKGQAVRRNIALPRLIFDNKALTDRRLKSPVPQVPPDVRPRFAPHNYHILFEVKEWEAYPVDPFLMRRISGMLFVIEAELELSPLEAELLASMIPGN